MNIGAHLKTLREKEGISAAKLAAAMGVDPERYRKWELRGSEPNEKDKERLERFFGVAYDRIIEVKAIPMGPLRSGTETLDLTIPAWMKGPSIPATETSSKSDQHILLRVSLRDKSKPVPVTNIKASGGAVVVYNDEPALILEYIEAPFLKGTEGTIEVVGHSMYPKYPNGTRVAIKRLEHKDLIRPGEDYYVIDKNYEGFVKRLYKVKGDAGLVELRSYNEDKEQYPNFQMSWEDIVAVFKVKAGIQLS